MKLTFTVEPSTEHRGYMDLRTQMEDDGDPLLDVTLSVHHSMVESQFAALAETLNRWWAHVNDRRLPQNAAFQTLGDVNAKAQS